MASDTMKRKVPSLPPPPLPPAKPRRAGALKPTRFAGVDNKIISDKGGGGGGGGGEEGRTPALPPRRRNNHRRKDSIPIPPPIHKYTTTNPSTMSPVYHLVYDLTSPPSPNYTHTTTNGLGPAHTSNNNNSVSVSTSTSSDTGSHPKGPSSTHLPGQGGQGDVDGGTAGGWGKGVQNGLQVKHRQHGRGGPRGERGEQDESDTGITGWGKPASAPSPPAPRSCQITTDQAQAARLARFREQNEAINAVTVNGDTAALPPPLPPPRVPTIINDVNGIAADGTNWDTVTNNTGPFFQPHLSTNLGQQTQHCESEHGYEDCALSESYRTNYAGSCKSENTSKTRGHENNQTLSRASSNNINDASQIRVGLDNSRGLRNYDRSQTFHLAGEGADDRDRACRGTRAEFATSEIPSSVLDLPPHRQGVRHELQTADATGISSSGAASSLSPGCVPPSGLSQDHSVNNTSGTLDGHRQVCFIGREVEGERCQVDVALGVRDQLLHSSSAERRTNLQCQSLLVGLDSGSVSTVHSGKDITRVRFACDRRNTESGNPQSRSCCIDSKKPSPVSECDKNHFKPRLRSASTDDKNNFSEVLAAPGRISVKDAVSLWDKPKSSYTEKSAVSSWSSPQSVEEDQHLKKAVFHRQGDSLRFFINHNDSGVVSDNEQAEGHNPPLSLESYVDPITGKPIDWIISTDSKSGGKSKQGSKNDRHAGIIAKVLDLTLSRGSGNTNSSKTPSLSLLSSFSSSKSSKSSVSRQQQQAHRPRPPVNRWDNIHVRTPQTHPATRPVGQQHVGQTFQTHQDNTAPALPPRRPSSSSLTQQQQQQQQNEAGIIFPSTFSSPAQVSDRGGGDSCVPQNNTELRNGERFDLVNSFSEKFAFYGDLLNQDQFKQFSGDNFNRESKLYSSARSTGFYRTENYTRNSNQHSCPSQRLNRSHDGVLHLELAYNSNGPDLTGSLRKSGLNTGAPSTSNDPCYAVSVLNPATSPQRDQSGSFASSISFDSEAGQRLRNYHPTVSSSLSPANPWPQPDPVRAVTASGDRSAVLTSSASRREEQTTPPGSELSPAPVPRGYRHDLCNGREQVVSDDPPPPPLPERVLSQQKPPPSSHSFPHKQEISWGKPTQRSLAALGHTEGDSSLSDHGKHEQRHGELIPFDHPHKVDYSGDLPELTSIARQYPHTEPELSNRSVNTQAYKPGPQSSSEDKLYQHNLREECRKNQLWNLYGFDLKENHWIRERLSSNNNNPSGLKLTVPSEPLILSGAEQEIQEQHRKPAKITPRQKFEILHSRVSEKVATNLRRHTKTPSDLDSESEEAENLDTNFITAGHNHEEISPIYSENHLKYLAPLNGLHTQSCGVYKESPRARFERDRAARTSAVNTRAVPDTHDSDARETSLRLNRSCDELDTETFGSRPGSDTSFLVNKDSLPRSFSPTQDVGQLRQSLAPPVPPKPVLCPGLSTDQFELTQAGPVGDPSSNSRDNSRDGLYGLCNVNHSLRDNSLNSRISRGSAVGEEDSFIAAAPPHVRDASIFAERPEQRISCGTRNPLSSITNQCSEKSVPVLATHIDTHDTQSCDTQQRVVFSPPVREAPGPRSVQQHYVQSSCQSEPVPDCRAVTGQWSGGLTTEPDRDQGGGRTENSLAQLQRAQGSLSRAEEKGQYEPSLTDAEIPTSDNRISAGSLHSLEPQQVSKDSSHFAKSSDPSPSLVSQSKRLLTVREDITTNLDPDTRGRQTCAQPWGGSISDTQALSRSDSSGPQKGPVVKKMSPGSVSSSGYESEINSAATQKLHTAASDNRNENSDTNKFAPSGVKTLSTVQQLRLRFGHNPGSTDSHFSDSRNNNPGNYEGSSKSSQDKSNECTINGQFNYLQLNQRELAKGQNCASGDNLSDSSEGVRCGHSAVHPNQLSPSRRHKTRHGSGSPRHSPKEQAHNKRLLKKVSRSMHGIIHDLKPVYHVENRHTPIKTYRSCQHRAHKRRSPCQKAYQSRSETGSGRGDSRSASASSECTICGEEAAASANRKGPDSQQFPGKTDSNNNLKPDVEHGKQVGRNQSSITNSSRLAEKSRNLKLEFTNDNRIDTYSINTTVHVNNSDNNNNNHNNCNNNGQGEPQIFRAKFFSREEAAMLAAKGLRIYESGEEYIAMRSPVKSPLHKSMSAPQFGWEGAHYLIIPTVVEPFNTTIATSAAAVTGNLNLALSPGGSRSRSLGDESDDDIQHGHSSNTNTLLTHRSISDSGASRRCSTSRFDGVDASDFFTGHRSDGDDYGDEGNGFDDINYNGGDDANNNIDNEYLPMRERKLSARHRAMSVDVLYRERPDKTEGNTEPHSPGRPHMMRRFFQPQVSTDRDTGRGYVEWKTCSGWVGKVDMRKNTNGRNSRGYVEWDTIWTAAAPWGAKEDDEHVYDVIAESSSTCSTEDVVPVSRVASTGGEGETVVKREREARGSVDIKVVTSVAADTPPALPERTYINKIKNTRTNDSNDTASSSSTSSTTGHRHHHHHHPHCKKHHHHHHHNHSNHHHHRYHNHQTPHPHNPQKPQHQHPPQRPLKPSSLSLSSQEQQQQLQQQSPSTSSPASTPTKSKAPPSSKPPPKPPRQPNIAAQNLNSLQQHQHHHHHHHHHQKQHHQQPISLNVSQHVPDATSLSIPTTAMSSTTTAAVSENYSEVHKLKGYKFTSLLTATESDSPVPQLVSHHQPDPSAIYSETYWHLGPAVAPQARATAWQSGDVLDYIDGLHDSMSPKRRENIYILLNNKKTRAKFSESLEIESRLLSKGLLSPSPSLTASASSSSPLPPSSVASASTPFPSVVMSRFHESSSSGPFPTAEVTSLTSAVTNPGSIGMAGSALTTPTFIATSSTRVIKRKGATAPVSSTYV